MSLLKFNENSRKIIVATIIIVINFNKYFIINFDTEISLSTMTSVLSFLKIYTRLKNNFLHIIDLDFKDFKKIFYVVFMCRRNF